MIDEEIEVKSNLGLLGFRNGLEGQERRSVRPFVASVDRHVGASGWSEASRVPEEALPERGQMVRVSAVRSAYPAQVSALSPRLREVVDSLPLIAGMRVIEIGCGPGAAAREVANRIGPDGHLLAVDRSPKAIEQLMSLSADLIDTGRLSTRTMPVEKLMLEPHEKPYHLAFAVRVGVLDGRHPAHRELALQRIAAMLLPGGRLFIDGGDPLTELALPPQ